MKTRLERRAFLKGALSCMVSLPALTTIGCGSEASTAPARLRADGSREAMALAEYFDDAELDAAAFIGQRYLAVFAPNASADEAKAIAAPVAEMITAADTDATALAKLRAKIVADFDAEATAIVDGWIFSLTELQLCVLLALIVG